MHCLPRILILLFLAAAFANASAGDYFRIQVVDDATGRGVPLVELTTVNHVRYVTDSAGLVAFDEPGLMNRRVFFHVFSHGYESPDGGFGAKGRAFETVPGGTATLRLKRVNIAERLYRVTGGGIYRDSVLLGDRPPLAQPLLNAGVLGSDSVVNAVFNGRVHWFWGDTNLPPHQLGIFDVPGSTSQLPSDGGLEPDVGIDFQYFVNESGTARPTAKMPGRGPTWIGGLTVLTDADLPERMFASYVKIKPPMDVYERGLVEFDSTAGQFRQLKTIPLTAPLFPNGHPFHATDNGTDYVYFPDPFPAVRVRATTESFLDLSQYEAWTCLIATGTESAPVIDRDEHGRVHYSWKRGVAAVQGKLAKKLVQSRALKPEELLFQLVDVDSGKSVDVHGGSVYWNDFRQRWLMIALESWGSSMLGELWYAEADTPLGPWQYARKIVTHEKYSFYNPKQHPMFDQNNGREIYFEGTYTHTFSGNTNQTPRYDYNQIMYRLDLGDERLALPVAVYRVELPDTQHLRHGIRSKSDAVPSRDHLAFYALDRMAAGSVPVYSRITDGRERLDTVPAADSGKPAFYALAADQAETPATTVGLSEFRNRQTGERRYSTSKPDDRAFEELRVVCRVWIASPEGSHGLTAK